MTRETWIRVKSEKELRAGMAVQIRNCYCGSTHSTALVLAAYDVEDNDCGCNDPRGYELIGVCTDGEAHECADCLCADIADGRLYRLSDAALDSTDETTTAPREREEVTR